MKQIRFFLFCFLFSGSTCFGQAGVLDSTFGVNGISPLYFPLYGPESLVLDSQSKIVLCGSYAGMNQNYCLIRYEQNGSLDNTFGNNGMAYGVYGSTGQGAEEGHCVTIQNDGKILVCGNGAGYIEIARYKTDGHSDSTFGTNGKIDYLIPGSQESEAWSLLVQQDGKIVISGTATYPSVQRIAIARFNINGSIDPTFGNLGSTTTSLSQNYGWGVSIKQQTDSKFLVGGYSASSSFIYKFALVRYNADGSLDNTFGSGGKSEPFLNDTTHLYEYANQIALQPDGKIIMVGSTTNTTQIQFGLLRFNTDGSLDNTFGNGGLVTTDFMPFDNINEGRGVTLQPDGKILVAGQASLNNSNILNYGAIARYKTNGTIDSTFGVYGKILVDIDSSTGVWPIIMQPDGKIVVGGGCASQGLILLRYLSGLDDGVLDLSIANNPLLIYPNPIQSQATLQYMLTKDEQITIELFDMQGKLVQQFITNETRTKGKHEEVLHLNELLPSGSYILNISNGKNSQGVKVVKE
ncbi:MAG: T9SS type A sorting domain-containing protein [Bacteroidota bacterium]